MSALQAVHDAVKQIERIFAEGDYSIQPTTKDPPSVSQTGAGDTGNNGVLTTSQRRKQEESRRMDSKYRL